MGFVQTGTPLSGWIRFTDRTTPSGSAFFNGSPVYLYGAEQNMTIDVIKNTKSIPQPQMPNFVNNNSLGISGSWNNMKGPTSFSGIANPKMSLQCNWSTDLTYTGTERILMNPYIALMFAASGRRFYLEDERIINSIKTWDLNSTNSMYQYGMPFTIDTVNFQSSSKDTSLININFTITEDKE